MKKLMTTVLLCGLSANAGAEDFRADSAWSHLLAQCAFGPRQPGGPGHDACLAYLQSTLRRFAGQVERQDFTALCPVTGNLQSLTNLVARFPSKNPRRVLLCAHWDTRPWADQDPNVTRRGDPILGANDGASGVAVLLEIARCLAGSDPGVTVDIVLFDGEDMGREGYLDEYLLGSREFVRTLQLPLPEAALLLDLVGDRDLSIPKEYYSQSLAPRLLSEVFALGGKLHPRIFVRRNGSAVYDDHIPLLEAGIPAVDLVDFDYPYWHTLQDTPEHCSPASLGAVGEVVLAWVRQRGGR